MPGLLICLFMVDLGFAQDKSAFGKTVGNIYTPGVKVLKVSGGYLKTKINGFIGLEYYFTERLKGSLVLGYTRDKYFGAGRTLLPIMAEGGLNVLKISNAVFFNVNLGFSSSLQSVGNLDSSKELQPLLLSGILGLEIMVNNIFPKTALFGDVRQFYGVNEDNHQVIYSIGIKRRITF